MERDVQEIELPGGQTVLASVRVLEPGALPDGADGDYDFDDTGALDRLGGRIGQLNELVAGVGSTVLDAARSVCPDEVSATFGIEIGVKPGKAVAILADGEVKGIISVTLTWRSGLASAAQAAAARTPPGHGQSGQGEGGHAQSVPAQQQPPAQQPQGPAQGGHVLPGQAQPGGGTGGTGPADSGQGPTSQQQ